MVDTPASGAGGRKPVKVQVLFSVNQVSTARYTEIHQTRKLQGLAGFLLSSKFVKIRGDSTDFAVTDTVTLNSKKKLLHNSNMSYYNG